VKGHQGLFAEIEIQYIFDALRWSRNKRHQWSVKVTLVMVRS
jgi:hypothetical protein